MGCPTHPIRRLYPTWLHRTACWIPIRLPTFLDSQAASRCPETGWEEPRRDLHHPTTGFRSALHFAQRLVVVPTHLAAEHRRSKVSLHSIHESASLVRNGKRKLPRLAEFGEFHREHGPTVE